MLGNSVDTSMGNITSMGTGTGGNHTGGRDACGGECQGGNGRGGEGHHVRGGENYSGDGQQLIKQSRLSLEVRAMIVSSLANGSFYKIYIITLHHLRQFLLYHHHCLR